jgi:predicted small lipoprotein YifL
MKTFLRFLWVVVALVPLVVGCSSNEPVEVPTTDAGPPPDNGETQTLGDGGGAKPQELPR